MPPAAPKHCTEMGCRVLVTDGTSRCQAHKAAAGRFADQRRGSRHARGYGSAWERTRGRILRRDAGLCQCDDCTAAGVLLAATEVDHRIGKAEWQRLHGTLDGCDDDANLRAINSECHLRKTLSEARAARGGARVGGPAEAAGAAEAARLARVGVVGKSTPQPLGTERLTKFCTAAKTTPRGVKGRGQGE
jgi:5-methylcytosine-specific restriction protein A